MVSYYIYELRDKSTVQIESGAGRDVVEQELRKSFGYTPTLISNLDREPKGYGKFQRLEHSFLDKE